MFVTIMCCYLSELVNAVSLLLLAHVVGCLLQTGVVICLLLVIVSLLLQSDFVVTNKPRYSSSDKPMQMLVPASFSAFLLISCWSFFTSYTMVVK